MPDYRRARVPGATYFFTVVTEQRRLLLCEPDVRVALGSAVRTVRSLHPFTIEAWVLLPDHLHCVWTLPPGDTAYALRWSLIKRGVSQRVASRLPAPTPLQFERRESGLWQRRYWEHVIRDCEDWRRHVDYIHWNPVKHGYVSRPVEWQFSTFHRSVRAGMYPVDWGVAEGVDGDNFGEP
jgi:putative transposase